MSIVSVTQALVNLMDTYEAQRESIQTSPVFSEGEKKRRTIELFNQTLPRAENVCSNLWGVISQTEDGASILSADAEVWTALARADVTLRRARDNAAKVSYPSGTQHIIHRLQTVLRQYGTPHEFSQWYYENASQEEQYGAQDYLQGMVNGSDWGHVFTILKQDRADRISTREVQSATVARNQVITETEPAAKATNRVINEFGRESYYLGNVENGIVMQIQEPRLARKTWGVQVGAGGSLTYSMDGAVAGGGME